MSEQIELEVKSTGIVERMAPANPGGLGHGPTVVDGGEELEHTKLHSLGKLAAGIIHEINTPVQYITDNLNFLADQMSSLDRFLACCSSSAAELDPLEIERQAQAADIAFMRDELPAAIDETRAGIEHVAKLVAAVRAFSHPDTTKRAVNLNEGIELMIAMSRNEWKHHAAIKADLEASLPPVQGSGSQLGQVWLNLITNAAQAIEANGEMGEITIASRVRDDHVEVSVGDNGPGMPEGVRARVFERFFTTKPKGRGTGQGLAICARIVADHGGTIEVVSALGAGTEFVVRLPVEQGV